MPNRPIESRIQVRFTEGLDTKTDSKLVHNKLLTLQNGVFNKSNVITKRYGYDVLGNSILTTGSTYQTIGQGVALANYDDELLMFDGNRCYSFSNTLDAWVDKGPVKSTSISAWQVQKSAQVDMSNPSSAINGTIGIYSWFNGTNIAVDVVDETTKTFFASNLNASVGYSPAAVSKCWVAGNYLFVSFVDIPSTSLITKRVRLNNPTSFDATGVVVSDVASANVFDIKPYNQNGGVFAYATTLGHIGVGYISTTTALGAPSLGLPNSVVLQEGCSGSLSVITDTTSNVLLSYYNPSFGMRSVGMSIGLGVNFGPITLDASASAVRQTTGVMNGTNSTWFYECSASVPTNTLVRMQNVDVSGNLGTASVLQSSVGLASDAFVYNNMAYVNTVYDSFYQSSYFCFAADGSPAGKAMNQIAGGLRDACCLAPVNQTSPGVFSWANSNKTKFTSVLNGSSSIAYSLRGVNETTIDFAYNSNFIAKQLGEQLHLAGGIVQSYDGKQWTEHGFNVFPENMSCSISYGTGSISSGSFEYFFTYAWTDAKGQLHESAPSIPQVIVITGSNAATNWTIPTLRLTQKQNVGIRCYRTINNGTNAFLISSLTGVLNNSTVNSASFVDLLGDQSIQAQQLMYANTDVDNIAPPAASIMTVTNNRLILSGMEDPNVFWYSKQFTVDEGVAFNDGFTVRVNPVGGPITALGYMDSAVAVFKENNVYVLYGNGPDDTGANSDYQLNFVTTDSGCNNQASVILMDKGIMFQSAKGIYLLPRGFGDTMYLGRDVEAYTGYTVTSAVLLANVNQVRFTLEGGPTLLYDYFVNQWSTFNGIAQNAVDAVNVVPQNIAEVVTANNQYVTLQPNGVAYKEDPNIYLDGTNNYSMKIGTGWITPADIQGFARVWWVELLGSLKSNHTLTMNIFCDYQDYASETILFNTSVTMPQTIFGQGVYGASVYAGGDDVYQFRHMLAQQTCQAIRFEFYDQTPGTGGPGYTIAALTLRVGIKQGLAQLGQSKNI